MDGDLVTFVGHSTVRLDLGGVAVLTDPILRERFLHARRVVAAPAPDVLDGLDAVLVSHLHMDHLDFRSIRGLDRDVQVLVPVGGGRVLRRRGFRNVVELRAGEPAEVAGLEVVATPADHDGRRWPIGPRVEAIGYRLDSATRVYFAGDTGLFDGMSQLAGDVDVAFLPIGSWGPKLGPGHLDGTLAAEAAAMIRPRMVVPIHWGTYLRMGLGRRPDLLERPPRDLAEAMARLAPGVEVRVLAPGESLALPRGAPG